MEALKNSRKLGLLMFENYDEDIILYIQRV